ncbi:TPA: glycosyltransferase, partial [Escherichia coli]|nr:glycosyltransferase [Escherichia coli]EKA2472142.1 glycosyltransferase [Escherichia coli]HAL2192905.1 glycosyltransferase [Escherichia coli]HAL2781463.1 glycosyltransferase [Escherichia coli]HCP4974971.1 glycosyltransferase [Escherichia coli]
MKNEPLISILIPTYNVGAWIDEAINSIIEQTYKKIEIIIIDDYSTDNTREKIQNLARTDSRIKIIYNKENQKIVKSLNQGLLLAKGQYIARFDGDDIAAPDRIEKQLHYLEANDLDIVGCQMHSINEIGEHLTKSISPVGEDIVKKVSKYVSPIAHIWLAKREVYDELQGYREIPYAEDYDFILRALDRGYKCDNHPEYLMYIRHRQGNSASVASLLQRKAHNYVLKLHKLRIRRGRDNFDVLSMHKKLSSSILIEKLHSTSSRCLALAVQQKSMYRRFFFIFLT